MVADKFTEVTLHFLMVSLFSLGVTNQYSTKERKLDKSVSV